MLSGNELPGLTGAAAGIGGGFGVRIVVAFLSIILVIGVIIIFLLQLVLSLFSALLLTFSCCYCCRIFGALGLGLQVSQGLRRARGFGFRMGMVPKNTMHREAKSMHVCTSRHLH